MQGREDKIIRWKYTLLVLDNMIDQITANNAEFKFSNDKESEINFVQIADNLPKLLYNAEKNCLGFSKSLAK
jgi:hypothetical protein